MKLSFEQVMELVRQEREHQDRKWGTLDERIQSIPGYITVAEGELKEAKEGWLKDVPGRNSSLAELIQVAAVCVAAIQQHGSEGNGHSNLLKTEQPEPLTFYLVRSPRMIDGERSTIEMRFHSSKRMPDLSKHSFLRINESGIHEYVPTEELAMYQQAYGVTTDE